MVVVEEVVSLISVRMGECCPCHLPRGHDSRPSRKKSGLIPQLVALGRRVAHISQGSIKNINTLDIKNTKKRKKNPQIRAEGFHSASITRTTPDDSWIYGAERKTHTGTSDDARHANL